MPLNPTDDDAVRNLVKARDLDRYWSTLFAPPDKRASLLAIYAFHLEIERIPSVVSEPMLGQIRLQWWRDAIEAASTSDKTGNPIADELTKAIDTHDLDKGEFFQAIDARSNQVFGDKVENLAAVHTFFDNVEGTTFRLAAAVLGDRGQEVRDASKDAAQVKGVINMISSANSYGSLGNSFFQLISGKDADREEASNAFATEALARFQATSSMLSRSVRPAFLTLALAKAYLASVKRDKPKPAIETVDVSPIHRFLILWRASQRRSLLV